MVSDSGDAKPDPAAARRLGDRMPWLEAIDQTQIQIEDDSMRRTWLIAGSAIVAMIVFSGLIWYLYGRASGQDPNAPLLVRAPIEAYKVEPTERGGMEVPHQERLVFGRVNGEEKPIEEKVQDGPEAPLERPLAAPEPSSPAAAEELPAAKPGAAAPVEPAPEVVVAEPEPTAREVPVGLAGNFRLQLGAFGAEAGARASWQAMRDRHAALLGALDYEIEPVTTGSRTLYRLRVGPFLSRAEAETTCSRLVAAGQACHVVLP